MVTAQNNIRNTYKTLNSGLEMNYLKFTLCGRIKVMIFVFSRSENDKIPWNT